MEQKGKTRLTDKQWEQMQQDYAAGGLTLEAIAQKYGCSRGQAWIVCSRAGQRWREQGGMSNRKFATQQQAATKKIEEPQTDAEEPEEAENLFADCETKFMTKGAQLKLLAEQSGFEVLDELNLPGRMPKYAPVPSDIHPEVREVLTQTYPQGLYSHQAQGLRLVLDGHDLCLATPTASGKSLVFMTATADRLKRDPRPELLRCTRLKHSFGINSRNGKKR